MNMSYFFQVSNKNPNGVMFITTEYLCEETTKGDLLTLALPSFYNIQKFYKTWFSRFSLFISNNEFLYEVNQDEYTIASNLNTIVSGKYFLIIYAVH